MTAFVSTHASSSPSLVLELLPSSSSGGQNLGLQRGCGGNGCGTTVLVRGGDGDVQSPVAVVGMTSLTASIMTKKHEHEPVIMAFHVAAISIVARTVQVVVVRAVFGGDGIQLVVAVAVQIATLGHSSGPKATKGEGGFVADDVVIPATYVCAKKRQGAQLTHANMHTFQRFVDKRMQKDLGMYQRYDCAKTNV